MATLSPVKVYVRAVTVATCTPSLLTTNPVTPSLSFILSGAGSFQVRVMEVVVWDATARFCGGPLGTERERGREGRCDALPDDLIQQ